ncbi:hypothetical protein [Rubinisphaera italica]|uniref:Uncharacterized protein n=1 Tax=Rubinisphaera italica TaxID=2527969 RepID=A0A5C5XIP8_9PLAN|nr:hypothetical protein [Rubinisphaera italica]TWT62231.1 hypothetical protein Pan54_29720 [Rubinisphaera italica]
MKPDVQALLLAERIWQIGSEGYIIAGTFTSVRIVKDVAHKVVEDDTGNTTKYVTSGSAGAPWVYVSLTNVNSVTSIQLQFTCLKKNRTLFGMPVEIECKDRLATVEMALQLPDLRDYITGEEGYYAMEVISEGEIIGSCRINTYYKDNTGE